VCFGAGKYFEYVIDVWITTYEQRLSQLLELAISTVKTLSLSCAVLLHIHSSVMHKTCTHMVISNKH
jgi:hypothetical protein